VEKEEELTFRRGGECASLISVAVTARTWGLERDGAAECEGEWGCGRECD
jgi:hypothetical protein